MHTNNNNNNNNILVFRGNRKDYDDWEAQVLFFQGLVFFFLFPGGGMSLLFCPGLKCLLYITINVLGDYFSTNSEKPTPLDGDMYLIGH